jgi:hypothetical protein
MLQFVKIGMYRRKMKGKFKKKSVYIMSLKWKKTYFCMWTCQLPRLQKILSSVKIYMFGVKKTEKNIDEF